MTTGKKRRKGERGKGRRPRADSFVGSASGYDSANTTPNRTSFLAFPTNSLREISCYTRKEIVRKMRALDANLGIYTRFKSKVRQHAVFKGITPDPVTKDAAWNELNKDRFTHWADNLFVYSIDG